MNNKNEPRQRSPLKYLNSADFCALLVCLAAFLIWVALLAYKYAYFGYYDWDLALCSQTMWNLSHGSSYVSLIGANFLANHSNYIAFLLTPIYFLFPHPFALITLKILSYLTAGYLIYLIGKKKVGASEGIIFMILYFLFPPNVFGNLFEFDFESMAMALICLTFYFLIENRLKGFLISALLLALVKENMPLIVIAFGIFALFTKKERKLSWGIPPILIGISVFYAAIFVITPNLRKDLPTVVPYVGLYRELGSSWQEIAASILLKPMKLISSPIAHPINLFYVRDLFGPLIFLAIFRPQIILIGSPLLLQHLLSNSLSQHTIFYHYSASIVPFIFIASIYTLKFFKVRHNASFYKTVLFVILALSILNSASYRLKFQQYLNVKKTLREKLHWELLHSVPRESSVIATFKFLPELSNRKDLFSFHNVWRGVNQLTGESPYQTHTDLDYALIDFNDPWIAGENTGNINSTREIQKFFLNTNWGIERAFENLVLFKKFDYPNMAMPLVSTGAPATADTIEKIDVSIDNKITLQSFQIEYTENAGITLPILVFHWKDEEGLKDNYRVVLGIKYQNGEVERKEHQIGYLIYPPYLWEKGDLVTERLHLLPKYINNDFSLYMAVVNTQTGEFAKLSSTISAITDNTVTLKCLK